MEVHRLRLDLCAISKVKNKGNETTKYNNYILIYSGKERNERAKSGVGLLIHKKYEQHITNIAYINDRLIHATLEIQKKQIDIVSVYAPDISKPKVEREEFYNQLDVLLNTIPRENKLILAKDFNAKTIRFSTGLRKDVMKTH